jgi:L-rhamnose mutarotase
MRIALHSRLRPDRIADYEQAHREVPAELTAAIRAAGASEWTIWRSGTDLFHVLEVEDYSRLVAELGALPVNAAWHVRMSELLEDARDYSQGDAAPSLPVVWQL